MINKQSQNMVRKVKDLHDWEKKSKTRINEMRKSKDLEELE